MSTTFNNPDTFIAKDFKRDRWGRPYIMQPNGKRIGYTRCSSAAKTIEDTYNLVRWDNRNIGFGMSYDASLVARILAIGGDPASWGKPEKDDVNEIVEAARGVAKAHKAADIGTAVHHLTHRIDRGEDVHGGPYDADLDAYVAAMGIAGLTIHPEWIECRMVNDELQMAGTADRIVTPNKRYTPKKRIADIKTGHVEYDAHGNPKFYGLLGWTAQGAAYAGGKLYDIDAEERLPTPDIDQEIGYIIHLPAGEGRCDIYEMDLRGGLRAAELANEIRAIRKESKAWITPIKIAPVEADDREASEAQERVVAPEGCTSAGEPVAPVATDPPGSAVEQPAPESAPPAGSGAGTNSFVVSVNAVDGNGEPHPHAGCKIVNGQCVEPTAGERRQALLARFYALGEAEQSEFRDIDLDETNLDEVEAGLNLVDTFTYTVAEAPPQTHKTAPAPRPQPPVEGADVGEADVEALKRRFAEMSPTAKAWAGAVPVESNAGHCWRINEKATVRRYELYRGVFALAEWGIGGDR